MKIKLVQHDPNLHTIKILHCAEGVRWPRPAHTRTNGGPVAGSAPPPGPGRPSSRDAPVPASIPRLPLPGDVRRMERTHCLVPLPHSRYTCRRAKDRDNGAVKNHGKSARTCPAGRDRPPSSSTGDSGHPPPALCGNAAPPRSRAQPGRRRSSISSSPRSSSRARTPYTAAWSGRQPVSNVSRPWGRAARAGNARSIAAPRWPRTRIS
jgi:hypothetical protein